MSSDPVEPLTAAALGQALGNLSEEMVRARSKRGSFSPSCGPHASGATSTLRFRRGAASRANRSHRCCSSFAATAVPAYGFLTTPNTELAGLTPIEVLIARVTHPRQLDGNAEALLGAPNSERLDCVLGAAKAYAADLAA